MQAAIAAMHGAAHAQAQGDNAGGVDQDWDGHDLSGSQRGTAEKVDQKRPGRSFGKRPFGYPSLANSTIQTRGDSSQGSASQPISPLASRRIRVSIRVGSDSSSFTRRHPTRWSKTMDNTCLGYTAGDLAELGFTQFDHRGGARFAAVGAFGLGRLGCLYVESSRPVHDCLYSGMLTRVSQTTPECVERTLCGLGA